MLKAAAPGASGSRGAAVQVVRLATLSATSDPFGSKRFEIEVGQRQSHAAWSARILPYFFFARSDEL